MSEGSWLERLGNKRAGLMLLAVVAAVAFGVGAASIVFFTEHMGLPDRVEALEAWSVKLDSIAENTEAVVELREDTGVIRAQVSELYCDRWPGRCVAAPGGSAPGGGGG